jgi:CRISPR-associated protein Cas2
MVVLVIERATDALRGGLRRWLLEVQAGVFVGNVSPRVRDELWQRVVEAGAVGAATLVHTARNEQGFSMRATGDPDRLVVTMDGLYLIARRPRSAVVDPDGPLGVPEPRLTKRPRTGPKPGRR